MPETDSRAVPTTGWAQTGAPPMRRLAATSDSISVRPQINPICSATTAENTRSTAVQAARRAFSWNFSVTQCDAACKLPASGGREQSQP